jgi:hypothetical protein
MVMRVAATDNTIVVDPPLTILGCELAERFQSAFSQIVFQPVGCDEDPQRDCTAARALIINDPPEPIAGSDVLLYSCEVRVAFDAAEGTYPLVCVDPAASHPDGQPYNGTSRCALRRSIVCETDADCAEVGGTCRFLPQVLCPNGSIVVSGTPLPTPTATPRGLTTELAANIDASDETIPLMDGSVFGESGTIEIATEKISYRAKVGNALTEAQRGKGGTTATEHLAGAQVTLIASNPGGSGGGRGCAITARSDEYAGWLLVGAVILASFRYRARRADVSKDDDESGRQST